MSDGLAFGRRHQEEWASNRKGAGKQSAGRQWVIKHRNDGPRGSLVAAVPTGAGRQSELPKTPLNVPIGQMLHAAPSAPVQPLSSREDAFIELVMSVRQLKSHKNNHVSTNSPSNRVSQAKCEHQPFETHPRLQLY